MVLAGPDPVTQLPPHASTGEPVGEPMAGAGASSPADRSVLPSGNIILVSKGFWWLFTQQLKII